MIIKQFKIFMLTSSLLFPPLHAQAPQAPKAPNLPTGVSNIKSDGSYSNTLTNNVTRTLLHTDRWISSAMTAALVATVGSTFIKYGIGKTALDIWPATAAAGFLVAGDIMTLGMYRGFLNQNISDYKKKEESSSGEYESQKNNLIALRKSYDDVKIMLETRRMFYMAASAAMGIASAMALFKVINLETIKMKYDAFKESILNVTMRANAEIRATAICTAELIAASGGAATAAVQACVKQKILSKVEPAIKGIATNLAIKTAEISKLQVIPSNCKAKVLKWDEIQSGVNAALGIYIANELIADEVSKLSMETNDHIKKFKEARIHCDKKAIQDFEFVQNQTKSIDFSFIASAHAQSPTDLFSSWQKGMSPMEAFKEENREGTIYTGETLAGAGLGAAGIAVYKYMGEGMDEVLDTFWDSPLLRSAVYATGGAAIGAGVVMQAAIAMQMQKNIDEIEQILAEMGVPKNEIPPLGSAHEDIKQIIASLPEPVRENFGVKDGVIIPCPGKGDGKGNCSDIPAPTEFPLLSSAQGAIMAGGAKAVNNSAHTLRGKKSMTDKAIDSVRSTAKAMRGIQDTVKLLKKRIADEYPKSGIEKLDQLQSQLNRDLNRLASEALAKQKIPNSELASFFGKELQSGNDSKGEKTDDGANSIAIPSFNLPSGMPATDDTSYMAKSYDYDGESQDGQLHNLSKVKYQENADDSIRTNETDDIFNVITIRYFKSAYPKLLEEKK